MNNNSNYTYDKQELESKVYNNRYQVLEKCYTNDKINMLLDNYCKLTVDEMADLGKYMIALYKECSTQYYNSEYLISHIISQLKGKKLEKELVMYYSREIEACIKMLLDISWGNLKLNKQDFSGICTLLLYISEPNYLIKINPKWYTLPAKIYIFETIFGLVKPLLNENINYNNDYLGEIINKLEGDAEDLFELELDDEPEEKEEPVKEDKFSNNYDKIAKRDESYKEKPAEIKDVKSKPQSNWGFDFGNMSNLENHNSDREPEESTKNQDTNERKFRSSYWGMERPKPNLGENQEKHQTTEDKQDKNLRNSFLNDDENQPENNHLFGEDINIEWNREKSYKGNRIEDNDENEDKELDDLKDLF